MNISTTTGDCIWQFPSIVTTVAMVLYITATITTNQVPVTINAFGQNLLSTSTSVAQTTYSVAIPAGTNLSGVTVEIIVDGSSASTEATTTLTLNGSVSVYEIWIQ